MHVTGLRMEHVLAVAVTPDNTSVRFDGDMTRSTAVADAAAPTLLRSAAWRLQDRAVGQLRGGEGERGADWSPASSAT